MLLWYDCGGWFSVCVRLLLVCECASELKCRGACYLINQRLPTVDQSAASLSAAVSPPDMSFTTSM